MKELPGRARPHGSPFSLRGQLDHEQAFVTARIEPGKVIAAAIKEIPNHLGAGVASHTTLGGAPRKKLN